MQFAPDFESFLKNVPATGSPDQLVRVPGSIYLPRFSDRHARAALHVPPNTPRRLTIAFDLWEHHGPAFFSAVQEISNEIGGRAEGRYEYAREESLTYALVGLGFLRAAVSAQVPGTCPHFGGGR